MDSRALLSSSLNACPESVWHNLNLRRRLKHGSFKISDGFLVPQAKNA